MARYLHSQKGEAYDLNGDGIKDVAVVDKEPPAGEKIKGVQYVVIGKTNRLSEGDHGYIEFGFSQGRKWDDKKYLRPIPLTATQINPALLPQNQVSNSNFNDKNKQIT